MITDRAPASQSHQQKKKGDVQSEREGKERREPKRVRQRSQSPEPHRGSAEVSRRKPPEKDRPWDDRMAGDRDPTEAGDRDRSGGDRSGGRSSGQ